ncbi:hypothetical protein BP6252_13914 [Coleophoma cylindrospora]|uniref:Major facilitator superfamily (MFS) profile domain-containing protein n=1 Tax=Coleophoma cylindrospora TaxID=1849047 RepID=A0A3D8Q5F5_9HELO|nr:hypothetical protein BP6252_13914 [Coleophoma cylindrospora]
MASLAPTLTSAQSAPTEVTPLLGTSATKPQAQVREEAVTPFFRQEEQPDDDGEDAPLPIVQIALLCYCRMVEPVAFFSIFPFINKMILETGNIEEADVGFYSGLIESLFSVTQMLLMISWGKAADRFGRKPVLVFSLSGVAVATTLFGFSQTIWQMILFRCIAGVFAGTIVTVRAMISENSTHKTQARAFSLFAFTAYLGTFLGPLLGGLLCNPADQYPYLFGNFQFLRDYPYALPTFATGLFGASAVFLATISKSSGDKASTDPKMSTWELLKAPGVSMVLYLYGHTMLLTFAYTVVLPLFWFTAPELGGFGFSPRQISTFLGLAGVSQALWTLLVFPPLQHRLGTGGVLRLCALVWPIVFAVWPICSILLVNNYMTAFWILVPTNVAVGYGVSMAHTCAQLALNDISPSHYTLGTLNAISLVLISGIRAFSPAVFTSIFAAGIRDQILGGYLVWFVVTILAIVLAVAVFWLPKKAEGKLKHNNSAD